MSEAYQTLIADDDSTMIKFLIEAKNPNFKALGISYATNPSQCRTLINTKKFDFIFLDIHFGPGLEKGTDLIPAILVTNPEAKICMMSNDDCNETIVKCLSLGITDFISKNGREFEAIADRIENFIEADKGEERNIIKGAKIAKELGVTFVSPKMAKVFSQVARARANPTFAILITGETGTGKELIARAIAHGTGKPFVAQNSAAITNELADSELFGHKAGSFTGSVGGRQGKFRAADGGDIFLDEIGTMSLEVQKKILRAIQYNEITPVGCDTPVNINVRVIAATHGDLELSVKQETFRHDLLQRLKGIWIEIPSVKDRPEDIPGLIAHFIKNSTKPHLHLSNTCMSLLLSYSWPGNVREIEKLINEMVAGCSGDEITVRDLPPHFKRSLTEELAETIIPQNEIPIFIPKNLAMKEAVDVFTQTYIMRRINELGKRASKTVLAEILKISRSTLDSHIKKFSLVLPES